MTSTKSISIKLGLCNMATIIVHNRNDKKEIQKKTISQCHWLSKYNSILMHHIRFSKNSTTKKMINCSYFSLVFDYITAMDDTHREKCKQNKNFKVIEKVNHQSKFIAPQSHWIVGNSIVLDNWPNTLQKKWEWIRSIQSIKIQWTFLHCTTSWKFT